MGDHRVLEAALGHTFADPELLARALVHRSAEVEDGLEERSNERLEFLGDAVLSIVIADELFTRYDLAEGEMAKVRAAVVSESTLAAVAREIELGEHLVLGRGEDASGGRDKPSIVADAMEAVIGALFLDAGLDGARRFVIDHWRHRVAERAESPGMRDYKTRLQEVVAQRALVPVYETQGEGPDHQRSFVSVVTIDGVERGRGEGTSKKRAEQQAARAALDALDSDHA